MGKIFISYRRNDSQGEALHLASDLQREFGDDSVFIDVNAIEPGLNFRSKIEREIGRCSVLLAIIGPNWTAPHDAAAAPSESKRHVGTDYVSLEISWAMKRRLRVIPVRIRGADMPTAKMMPAELKNLAVRNAIELRHDHWKSDLNELVTVLRKHIAPARIEPAEEPVEAAVEEPIEEEVVAIAPQVLEQHPVVPAQSSDSNFMTYVVVFAIAVVIYFVYFRSSTPSSQTPQPAPAKVQPFKLKPK